MRILVVPKWYPWPDRPVFGVFCQQHALALARRHDVVVIASDAVRSPDFLLFSLSESVEEGIRTLRLRYRRPRLRPTAMGFQLLGLLVALHRLRRTGWSPQIIHAHVYSAGLPAAIIARPIGVPLVITEHYTGFQREIVRGYDRFTARLAFRLADLVAPVTDALVPYVRELAPRARIAVVPNVVDTALFRPAPDEVRGQESKDRGGETRLLCVASLSAKKGHADLLNAIASLRDELTLKLDLVGEGEERRNLERLSIELGIREVVHFHGELSHREVAALMRAADLFVLPSHYENLPCVLIESLASGLPAVATAVGGIPTLAGGRGLMMCPPHDPAALADAIRQAIRDRTNVSPRELAEWADEHYGFDAIERVWSEHYRQLLSGR